MTSRDFAYWLQGLFELSDITTLNEKQTELIRKYLALVFIHEINPYMGDDAHQETLNTTHNGLWNISPFQTTGISDMKFRS